MVFMATLAGREGEKMVKGLALAFGTTDLLAPGEGGQVTANVIDR